MIKNIATGPAAPTGWTTRAITTVDRQGQPTGMVLASCGGRPICVETPTQFKVWLAAATEVRQFLGRDARFLS